MAKPITTWYTSNRNGSLVFIGNLSLVDNLGNFLVDNLQNQLVTNLYQLNPRPSTVWSPV